jgi:hypothetical protein
MKYADEMGSGTMIYIPSFIKIGSGIQKLIRGDSQTHRKNGNLKSLLFFQNKESRLKIIDDQHEGRQIDRPKHRLEVKSKMEPQ